MCYVSTPRHMFWHGRGFGPHKWGTKKDLSPTTDDEICYVPKGAFVKEKRCFPFPFLANLPFLLWCTTQLPRFTIKEILLVYVESQDLRVPFRTEDLVGETKSTFIVYTSNFFQGSLKWRLFSASAPTVRPEGDPLSELRNLRHYSKVCTSAVAVPNW